MRPRTKRSMTALAGAAAALVIGCGDYNPFEGSRSQRDEDRDNALVLRYCSYGSASVPDLEDCIQRVSPRKVRSSSSNAARYASGELANCRGDAGPYCGKIGP